MSTIQDTDLLLINRAGVDYKCTVADWRVSQAPATKPPVIGGVVLADVAGGGRFTSQAFPVTVTMTDDGTPASSKGLKAWVEGLLHISPETDPITKIEVTPGDDGSAWTLPANMQVSSDWRSGASDDKTLALATGQKRTARSNDGLTWTVTAQTQRDLHAVCYTGSRFVIAGQNTDQASFGLWIGTTTDGITLTETYSTTSNTGALACISNNTSTSVVIAAGDQGWVLRSSNGGTSFTRITSGLTFTGSWKGIACDSSSKTWVLVGPSGEIARSTDDGLTWTSYTVGTNNRTCCRYADGKFVIGGDGGLVWLSTTGAAGTWSAPVNVTGTANYRVNAVRYMNGMWWAGVEKGFDCIYRSIDAITWTKVTDPYPDSVRGLCYLPGKVIALGNSGRAAVTTVSTTKFEFAGNTSLSLIGANAALTEIGNNNDGTANAIRIEPAAVPPYMMVGGITGTWDVGSRVGGPPIASSTRVRAYCVLNGTGSVTSLQAADPGFTAVAGTSPYHITFAALMPSGAAPDADIPTGSTLTVAVEASNTAGTVSATSNSITPA